MLAEQAADDVEQRRLAAAGRADDGEEFAGLDGQGDVVDGDDRAFRRLVTHGDVGDFQDVVVGRCRHRRYSLLRVITAVMAAV